MSHDSDVAANNNQLGHQTMAATTTGLPPLHGHQGQPNQQNPLADTLSALTADPNFTAALAAAITSLIGNSHQNSAPNNNISQNVNSNNNPSVTTSNNNNSH